MDYKKAYRVLTVPKAINPDTLHMLLQHWEALKKNNSNHIVILKGENQLFCKGLDFKWLGEQVNTEAIDKSISLFSNFLKELFESRFITIAVISGAVMAGGVGLACACDFILAEEESTYQLSEAMFDLIPGIILPFMNNRLTIHSMKLLYLSCKILSANEAIKLGLVDALFNQSNEDEALSKVVKQFLHCSASVIEPFKTALADFYVANLNEKLTIGVRTLSEKLSDQNIKAQIEEFTRYGLLPENEVGMQ